MSYKIGAVEVGVDPVTAAQIAPAGTASPAAAAIVVQNDEKKQALKDIRSAGGGVDGKVVLLGAALLGLGAYALWGKKKSSGGGHKIAGR